MNIKSFAIAVLSFTVGLVSAQSGSTVYSITKSNATQAGGGNAVNEKMCWMGSYGRGVGTIPNQCNSGMELRDGLCYKPCAAGYKGVGPVCWADNCPTQFPTKCGLGCAVNSTECGWAIFDQVSSVGEAIFNIATFGSGSAATTTARVGTQVAKTTAKTTAQATIKQQLKNRAREMGKELAESCAENAALMCYDAQLTGEFAWESLDPTGIANIVKAFNKPLCTDFF